MNEVTCQRLRNLLPFLESRIKGQHRSLVNVAAAACRWKAGCTEIAPRMLFLGPTGVGKTESTLAVSHGLFEREPVRLDMSEYQRQESIDRLLGNRSGDPGLLRQVINVPEGVLLIDELEKAHSRVLDLLLQMLEPAHVTAAAGHVIDLTNYLIICTSNLSTAGLATIDQLSPGLIEQQVLAQAGRELRQELLNRFELIEVFQPLDFHAQREMLSLHLDQYQNWLRSRGFAFSIDPPVYSFFMRNGFDRHWGARPLRRTIRKFIGDAIVEALLSREKGCGRLAVAPNGSQLCFKNSDDVLL